MVTRLALAAAAMSALAASAGAAGPLLGIAAASDAAVAVGDEIATLEAAGGRVTVIRLGQAQAALALHAAAAERHRGDAGRVAPRCAFMSDGAVVRIGPDSRVQIDETAKERDITLFFGRLWAHVVRFKERPTRFKSGSTIAAIRGTEISLAVAVDGDETQLSVLEGRVLAETDAGSLPLEGGQTAVGRKGKAPILSIKVRPQDAVQLGALLPAGPLLQARRAGRGTGRPGPAAGIDRGLREGRS